MATAQLETRVCPQGGFASSRGSSFGFWLMLALTAGISWRIVRYLLRFPIWGDESFVCINLLDKTYSDLIGPLRAGQLCPLPFLWGELAMFRSFGPSELALRALPLLAGLASLVLFWQLCRRILPPLTAGLALAILAVSYYPVRHAVEVKPYAGDLLAALGLLLPAACHLQNPSQARWLASLVLLVPLAIVSSYPAVFVAGAISAVLLASVWRTAERRPKAWFMLYNLLLLAAFVGNYHFVAKPQVSPHEASTNNVLERTFHDGFPPSDPVGFLTWLVKAHTGNMMAYPVGGANFGSTLTGLLCLVGAWSLWRRGDRLLLALLIGPFVLSLIAGIVHKYPYGSSARLDQHLAPSICMLMACGIVFFIPCWAPARLGERRAAAMVLALLASVGTVGMVRDIIKPYKTTAEVWNRDFAADLVARLGPNDRLVIFHAPDEVRPGLEWYLHPHRERIDWRGAIDCVSSSGNLWCLQMYINRPVPDPISSAAALRGARQTAHFQSIAPAEHCLVPEVAEVFCFSR